MNIKEIKEELNVGFDSMVFIDDNPVERDEIRHELKDVIVPDFPEDSTKLPEFMDWIYQEYFFTSEVTNEDKVKTELYQQRKQREEEKNNYSSLNDYLQSLNTKVVIDKVKETDINRVVQLTQKTNQFNLTTKRYEEFDIRRMLNDNGYDLWVGEVSDKFGNNGKTVLLILKKEDGFIEIDSFIMSCRIMGRYIEDGILHKLEQYYLAQGYELLRAKYIATKKNKPVETLYDRIGYSLLYQNEHEKEYEFVLNQREKSDFAEVQWKDR